MASFDRAHVHAADDSRRHFGSNNFVANAEETCRELNIYMLGGGGRKNVCILYQIVFSTQTSAFP